MKPNPAKVALHRVCSLSRNDSATRSCRRKPFRQAQGPDASGEAEPAVARKEPPRYLGSYVSIFATAVAMLFAGCTALKPVPETTRYYTLVPPAQNIEMPAATSEKNARRVGVRVTAQTDYLRRPPMAVRVGSNELRFAEGHRWGERVDEGAERALALALQTRVNHAVFFPMSHGAASGITTMVDVVVAACEGTKDGAAFECYWRVHVDAELAPAASGHFHKTRPGWDGADYAQLAAMLGGMVDELASEIAPAIPK
jgi:uncharacterized lipoprotein YmbA